MQENLPYTVNIPWPIIDINDTSTWFRDMSYLESWLDSHIGKHNTEWAYVKNQEKLVLGFSKPQYKTFFLIAYDK